MDRREPEVSPSADTQTSSKKPYNTPVLKVHGDVDKLTRLLAGGGDDGILGSQL